MHKTQFLLGAIALAIAPGHLRATTLTDIPMQGGMLMPMVAYHAGDGRLHVTMPSEIPQLTPLLVSNPGDQFDPADPWFDILDPSRQGASFSRRYGFMMDASSDPLPAGKQMWIRKLSGAPALRFYRASSSPPKAFTPIFGTDGSTNALFWDAVMFHPVVTAPPGTNTLSATFEVFLLDTATGQEVPNSTSGPLTFQWTNQPDGRPALSLAQKIVVAWPSETAANWVLETATAVDATNWTTVTNVPVILDGQPSVILDSSAVHQYFRMRYQP